MRREKLVRRSTKKAIALATAFMLTMNQATVLSTYAEETQTQSVEESEEESSASDVQAATASDAQKASDSNATEAPKTSDSNVTEEAKASDSNATEVPKASDSNATEIATASDSNATEVATSSDADLATETGDGNLLDDIGYWYITEYTETQGYYYDENNEKITDSFICIDSDREYVIHVDDNGKVETTKWLSEDTLDGKKFRYANAEGQVRIDESEVFDDGWYGDFDAEGYWTPISDTMFISALEDGTEVQYYSGEEGRVAGIWEDTKVKSFYVYATKDEESCWHLIENTATSMDSATKVTNCWIGDFYVGSDGQFITSQENIIIGGSIYNFDENGYSTWIGASDVWYVTEYTIVDGYYYDNTNTKLTLSYILDIEKGYIIYVDENGAIVTGEWLQLGSGAEQKFRYVDGIGKVKVDMENVFTGGYYGSFDEDGYFTPNCNQFFDYEGDVTGPEMKRYAGDDGEVAFDLVDGVKEYYCFAIYEGEPTRCYRSPKDQVIVDTASLDDQLTLITSIWIDDMRVSSEGIFLTNLENIKIDNQYYNFDADGHATLINTWYETAYELKDGIYYDMDGTVFSDAYVYDEDLQYIVYVVDGVKWTGKWISVTVDGETKYRYVDGNGKVKIDKENSYAGGYFGNFDTEGYWTANENQYFTIEFLDENVQRYAGEGGKVTSGYILRTIGEEELWYAIANSASSMDEAVLVTDAWFDSYYIGTDSKFVTNCENYFISNRYYDFDVDGDSSLVTNRYITDGENSYYVDAEGILVTDEFVTVDDETYYFGTDGAQVIGPKLISIGEDVYCIGETGEKVISAFATIEGNTYYFGTDGIKITTQQLVTIDGSVYCVDANGEKITSAFATVGEETYYFGADGAKVSEQQFVTVDEQLYCVDDNGEKILDAFATVGEETYYFGSNGIRVVNNFVTDDAGTYYVDSDGQIVMNQFTSVGEETYYFGADGLKVMGTFIIIDGVEYYLDENGVIATNQLLSDEEGTYYLDANGQKVTETFQVIDADGTEFYFGADGKQVLNSFITVSEYGVDDIYAVDADGKKVISNFVTIDEITYYFGEDGKQVIDRLLEFIGDYYYIDPNGIMVSNQFQDYGDQTIYLGEDGKQWFNKWIGSDEEGWRYVDSTGWVLRDVVKAITTTYGVFDSDGYWHALENQIFASVLNDEWVYRYVGEDGKILGIGDDFSNMSFYCFSYDDMGIYCYLLANGQDPTTTQTVTNTWIGAMRADDTGYLIMDDHVVIDEMCYRFNEEGYSSVMVNKLFTVTDGETSYKAYADENGYLVRDQYIYDTDEGEYRYFDETGALVKKHWIGSYTEGWKYADSDGYILRNITTATGNIYGTFDADGWWESIDYTFFESTLSSGATVIRYSGTEGKIAGIGNDSSDTSYYCFQETENGIYCYMLENQQDSSTASVATEAWVEDLRIDANGYLMKDCDAPVDGVYYHFDEVGHSSIITYTISYNLNGGSNSSANVSSYTGNDSVTLAAPSRSGYIFAGWYTDSSLTKQVSGITSKSSGNVTLYAKWTSANYSNNNNDNDNDENEVTTQTTEPVTATEPVTEMQVTTPAVTVTIPTTVDEPVTVTTGEVSVEAVASQTSEGSVNNNTIVTVTEKAEVTVSEGQTAEIATIAVSADGSTRSLLASETLGTTVQQVVKTTAEGVEVTQNVVVYTDGTQITQKSGSSELEGFEETVVAVEQAIQNGTQSVAEAYNDKVEVDLHQFEQVGAAVTFEVVAGANGAVSQTQMEQTSFTAGQEITALITDSTGAVTTVSLVVGENGIIQYNIPGVNCVVRYLVPKTTPQA